ncbi:MAG: galactonate dehydratase [Planctomycetota bacterium]
MKVTELETFFVEPRWVFLKMGTDAGIVGWGEPVVEGWSQSVAAAVREMGRYLVGKDPRRIEHHWQALYRGGFYRGGPVLTSALSGIEQAMWDVKGKALGVPAHELLGGRVRDQIRVYCHVNWSQQEKYLNQKSRVEAGQFTAVKTSLFNEARFVESKAFVEQAAGRMASLREDLGDEVDIGVDFHGRVSPALAVQLAAALESYQPMFIEEPVLPGNVEELARVAHSTKVPVATGERLFTKWAFREVLEEQAAAILQPDLSHAGGIFEVRKIAAMAEAHYAAIAPHCPLGPISLAACLQVDACTPNFLCQEQVTLGERYLREPFEVKEGYVDVPVGPGLGVEVDEEAVAEGTYAGDWDNPRLWHEDGSVADW